MKRLALLAAVTLAACSRSTEPQSSYPHLARELRTGAERALDSAVPIVVRRFGPDELDLSPGPDRPPVITVPLGCDASDVSFLEIEAKVRESSGGRLLWRLEGEGRFRSRRFLQIPLRGVGAAYEAAPCDRILVCLEDKRIWRGLVAELMLELSDVPTDATVQGITLYRTNLQSRRVLEGAEPQVRRYILDEESCEAVSVRAPSSIEIDRDLPEAARLRFGYGLPHMEWNRERAVSFRVLTIAGGSKSEVFAATVIPDRQAPSRWSWADVDLGPSSGGHATLVFEVESEEEADALWAAPLLYGTPTTTRPPNVLMISIDTLRADRLSCYGHPRLTSPNIDAFAQQAFLFERAFSQTTTTLGSHLSLFTSLYPPQLGPLDSGSIGPETRTLAALLRDAGYATVAFTDGGQTSDRFGLGAGFDRHEFEFDHLARLSEKIERACQWIADRPSTPFFMLFHTYGVHSPYSPEREEDVEPRASRYAGPLSSPITSELLLEYASGELELGAPDREYIRTLYDAGIAGVDRHMGLLFSRLEAMGLFDDTIVVLLSDHGEALFEHGAVLHDFDLHGTTTHVPLVIRVPDVVMKERSIDTGRSASPVELVDVVPTVLDLLEMVPPADPPLQGRSLVSIMLGEPGRADTVLTFQPTDYGSGAALRTNDALFFELSYHPGHRYGQYPAAVLGPQLFDLTQDPGEIHNLAPSRPDLVERYRDSIERRLSELENIRIDVLDPGALDLGQDTIDQLRQLGYVR